MNNASSAKARTGRRVRAAAGIVIAFVACVMLCIFVLSCVLACALSENGILTVLKDTSYAERIVPYLEEELNELANPSGLPERYFTGKTDSGLLEAIAEASVSANYRGESFRADTAALKEELTAGFYAYAEEKGIEASGEAVDYLATQCANEYVKFGSPRIITYLSVYAGKLSRYLYIAIAVSFVIGGLLLFYLFKAGMVPYARFAFGGAGLLMTAAPLTVLIGQFAQKLNISPEPFRVFVATFIERPVTAVAVIGGILLLLAVLLVFLPSRRITKPAPEHTDTES